ncbi:alpha/beta hydrolase [Trichocoleus desertorum]|uniref:Alpha/beta hydrolase n=1 Tax=Trichocoleus desertorum GB2-A4 TaxID=2933944 RepID=A0ABV0J862_9CYAN
MLTELESLPDPRILTIPLQFGQLDTSSQPAAYLEMGSGPTLVLLHGFLGTGACWLPLMQKLRSHYRCISLDLLGFGNSGKPAIRYDIATEVAFVRQVVEALNLGSCYFIGHSFGGWVAAAYALQYPNAVNGLVLAAAAGIRDDSFCGRYDHLRPLLWPVPVVDWGLHLVKPLAGLLGQRAAIAQLSWFRQELKAQPAARSFLLDRLRPEDAIDTVEQQIHQLRLPTLVITGDRDETIPLWHSQTYAKQIPSAELAIIPEADHALPQKYADEMAELILQFFANQTDAISRHSSTHPSSS